MADMNHIWTVKRDGKEIGTVEAITRKGACHEAYVKFAIPYHLQRTIAVERQTLVPADDLALTQELCGEIVCSFNPALPRGERP